MGRKRCFESLEERRLLADVGAALATPSPASPIVDSSPAQPAAAAATTTPDSAAATSNAAPDATPGNSFAPPDAAMQNSAESPNEYASGNGAASDAAATTSYAASDASGQNSYGQPADEYANARSYSSAATESTPYYTPAQSDGLASLAAIGEQTRASQTTSPLAPAALAAPATSGAAASGAAASGGAAPGGVVGSRPSDLVERWDLQAPLAIAQSAPALAGPSAELAVPIALLAPGGAELASAPTEGEITSFDAETNAELEPATPAFAGLIAGPLAANLDRIEREVDALFERLERWGAEWTNGAGPRRFGQALVAAAGAAAAWEYARARRREAEALRAPYDWRAPRELQLPRRLARRRSAT